MVHGAGRCLSTWPAMPLTCLLALLLAACGDRQATEIVLVVDTELAAARTLSVEATYPSGQSGASTADLEARPAPRTLVLLHRGGELGPVDVKLSALDEAGDALITVERRVRFEPERSLTLHVFLGGGCASTSCSSAQTCGNDGRCRSPEVVACEYEGRSCSDLDGGPLDAAPLSDAGPLADAAAADGSPPLDGGDASSPCPLVTVCGLADQHLPGDRVVPRPCEETTIPVELIVTDPDGSELAPVEGAPGAYELSRTGLHAVRVAHAGDATCYAERSIFVASPSVRADEAGASSGELRDLAARVGSAFVAGQNGAYAVGRDGWVELVAVAGGSHPTDYSAVTMLVADPVFGPSVDHDAVYRIETAAPFESANLTRVRLPDANRAVYDLGTRVDGTGEIGVATPEGVVMVEIPPGPPSAQPLGPGHDTHWLAVGASGAADRGRVWAGAGSELWNLPEDGSAASFMGQKVAVPGQTGNVIAAVVDDEEPSRQRLWLCGEAGVAVYPLDAYTWSELTEMPAPDGVWSGTCADLAVDRWGNAWVVTGGLEVLRLDPEGRVRLSYGPSQGLLGGLKFDRVAVASDEARREVWLLDRSSSPPQLIQYAAGLPPR